MLHFQFGCVLCHCILEGIIFVRLENVNMLLYLVEGGVVHHHILQKCGW
jgi:hypothetical protein